MQKSGTASCRASRLPRGAPWFAYDLVVEARCLYQEIGDPLITYEFHELWRGSRLSWGDGSARCRRPLGRYFGNSPVAGAQPVISASRHCGKPLASAEARGGEVVVGNGVERRVVLAVRAARSSHSAHPASRD